MAKISLARKNWLLKQDNLLKYLYPKIKTMYGPYLQKDGRYRVVLYTGKKKSRTLTRQYCRLKMEIKFERLLTQEETVDHLDGDFTNDKYSNLEIKLRDQHIKDDARRLELKIVNCTWCNKQFQVSFEQAKANNKAGPFCSKSCSGKYGASVQNGGIKQERKYTKSYFNNKGKKFTTYR